MTFPDFAIPASALDVLFWIGALACGVSQVFILRAVMKVVPAGTGSSDSTPVAAPAVPAPRRAMEIAWAILPAVLMIGAFVGAWRLMHPSTSSDTSPSPSALIAPAPRA